MLRELLTIFRSGDPLASMGKDFTKMLALSRDLTLKAGVAYFGSEVNPEDRTRLFKKDVAINKLERKIRKRVIHHLSFPGNQPSVPYCLMLMSLVPPHRSVIRAGWIGVYLGNDGVVRRLRSDPSYQQTTGAHPNRQQ
ncbi:MAG: hypothetical protein IH968_07720 [Gemmatimonadetes bacterium]|nr:hypothetical protein [Gemmatimonadota bacterium]